MPEQTQQEWLEAYFAEWFRPRKRRGGGYAALAAQLAAALPSSPLGLAVKQVMEAARAVLPHLQAIAAHDEREQLLAAFQAARKAGVG